MEMVKSVYTLERGQEFRGQPMAAGEVFAEIVHPAHVEPQHVIEALRLHQSLKVTREAVAAAVESDEGESPVPTAGRASRRSRE